MAQSIVLAGLVTRRADLVGQIEELEDRLNRLRADLFHLEAAINLVSPGFRFGQIRGKRKRGAGEWFGHGELVRAGFDLMRPNPEAIVTTREIAVLAMQRRGFDPEIEETVQRVKKRVDSTMRRQQAETKVMSGGKVVGWRLVQP
jgi:hypothetical protein